MCCCYPPSIDRLVETDNSLQALYAQVLEDRANPPTNGSVHVYKVTVSGNSEEIVARENVPSLGNEYIATLVFKNTTIRADTILPFVGTTTCYWTTANTISFENVIVLPEAVQYLLSFTRDKYQIRNIVNLKEICTLLANEINKKVSHPKPYQISCSRVLLTCLAKFNRVSVLKLAEDSTVACSTSSIYGIINSLDKLGSLKKFFFSSLSGKGLLFESCMGQHIYGDGSTMTFHCSDFHKEIFKLNKNISPSLEITLQFYRTVANDKRLIGHFKNSMKISFRLSFVMQYMRSDSYFYNQFYQQYQ